MSLFVWLATVAQRLMVAIFGLEVSSPVGSWNLTPFPFKLPLPQFQAVGFECALKAAAGPTAIK